MFPVYVKMKEADGIILASPVYYGSASALIKGLIERAGWISLHNNNPLRGKVGGTLAVSRRVGQNFTLAQLNYWLLIQSMTVPGSTPRTGIWHSVVKRVRSKTMRRA
jgi:multimeric flavodoxin WrbA